jgi:hypothetical protein
LQRWRRASDLRIKIFRLFVKCLQMGSGGNRLRAVLRVHPYLCLAECDICLQARVILREDAYLSVWERTVVEGVVAGLSNELTVYIEVDVVFAGNNGKRIALAVPCMNSLAAAASQVLTASSASASREREEGGAVSAKPKR